MKHYAIYQFLVENGQEKNLLVGFVQALSEREAKQQYAMSRRPADLGQQEFLTGYLSAHECAEETVRREDLIKAIDANRARLSVWA